MQAKTHELYIIKHARHRYDHHPYYII